MLGSLSCCPVTDIKRQENFSLLTAKLQFRQVETSEHFSIYPSFSLLHFDYRRYFVFHGTARGTRERYDV